MADKPKFKQKWSVTIYDSETNYAVDRYYTGGPGLVISENGRSYHTTVATGYGESPTEAAKNAATQLRNAEEASLKQAAKNGNTATQIEKLLQITP